VPITVRFLEALVRLAQAHARLLLRRECGDEDALMAILLMEQSAHSLKMPLKGLIAAGSSSSSHSTAATGCFTSSPLVDSIFLSEDFSAQARTLEVLKAHILGLATDAEVWARNSEAALLLTESISGESPLLRKRSRQDDFDTA
jgi:hypothetical protein